MGELQKVSDLGELGLIERIRGRLASVEGGEIGPGDDAALVSFAGPRLLYTVDALVEGVDFDFSYASGADVGWKAIAVNASDVAAMGGTPSHVVIALLLHPDTDVSLVDSLVEGVRQACSEWDIEVAGGDISEAEQMSVVVTMTGAIGEGGAIARSGAATGDVLCVTGTLGAAAAGLFALRRGLLGGGAAQGDLPSQQSAALTRLSARHLRPRPRLREGPVLAALGATAMIDVSDGLIADCWRLSDASGIGCRVDPGRIPIDPDLTALAAAVPDLDPMETAVAGGEDFELLFTLPTDRLESAAAAIARRGAGITAIGAMGDDGCWLGDKPFEDWRETLWEHLRGR